MEEIKTKVIGNITVNEDDYKAGFPLNPNLKKKVEAIKEAEKAKAKKATDAAAKKKAAADKKKVDANK